MNTIKSLFHLLDDSNMGYIASLYRFYRFFFINLCIECIDSFQVFYSFQSIQYSLCMIKYMKTVDFQTKNRSYYPKFQLFSIKRILILSILFTIIPILITWNHFGFFLDNLFFCDWKKENINEPLFIIGNARSGTTLMHRILSEYNDLFTTLRTWEIFFAMPITYKYMFRSLYYSDQWLCNGILYRLVQKIESNGLVFISYLLSPPNPNPNPNLFHKIKLSLRSSLNFSSLHSTNNLAQNSIHSIGLNLAEEDEWTMVHIFSSQLILLFFPLGLEMSSYYSNMSSIILFDKISSKKLLSNEVRTAIMEYYKDCVKRHLYVYKYADSSFCFPSISNNKTYGTKRVMRRFLSKNPPFTLRLETMHKVFPDMKVCCMIRDPIESIPSMVSYISKVWKMFSVPTFEYPNAKELIGFCQLHYSYPIEYFEKTGTEDGNSLQENQKMFLSYHFLIEAAKSSDPVLFELFIINLIKHFYVHTTDNNSNNNNNNNSIPSNHSQDKSGYYPTNILNGHVPSSTTATATHQAIHGISRNISNHSINSMTTSNSMETIDIHSVSDNATTENDTIKEDDDRDQNQNQNQNEHDEIRNRLKAAIQRQRMEIRQYQSSHHHPLEMCCNMTEEELKDLMKSVYRSHPTHMFRKNNNMMT